MDRECILMELSDILVRLDRVAFMMTDFGYQVAANLIEEAKSSILEASEELGEIDFYGDEE